MNLTPFRPRHEATRDLTERVVIDYDAMELDDNTTELVRRNHLFSGLSRDVFDGLLTQMSLRKLDAGEILFHRGDEADSFFYIVDGRLSLAVVSATGEKKILEIAGPGMTIAEAIAFLKAKRYPVTAEALNPCSVVRIPHEDYVDMLSRTPEACMRLLADVSKHLHSRVRDIENLTVQNARFRLASYMLDHVTKTAGDTADVHLPLPRNVIASRLSITPETLSRILRSLSEEGVISIDDRDVHVHSLRALRPYD